MARTSQRGLTLVEMMVGLAIGLIGLLAVAQIFVTFSQQRNTATQTMEAQSNGVMALYLLERDLMQAGYGLMPLQSCRDSNSGADGDGDGVVDNDQDIHWYYFPASCSSTCGVQPQPLSSKPVQIVENGSGPGGDSLVVHYANAITGAPGTYLLNNQSTASDSYKVSSVSGFSQGDMAVVMVGDSCTLFQVTEIEPGNRMLRHTSTYSIMVGGASESRTSAYNPSVADPNGAAPGWENASLGNLVVNLGQWMDRTYSISENSALQMRGYLDSAPAPLVEGIVYLKAQYGLNTTGGGTDKSIDLWSTDLSAVTSGGRVDYGKVLAIRIGIVARSPLREKEPVDAPATLTVLPGITDATGSSVGAAVTYTVPDRRYRYKVYSTIIPLRNMIWGG
ncbi:MAG: PilW family protein [Methylophilaceae bacterium]|nr:PilW family protein [Methylophilaceae bacterium]